MRAKHRGAWQSILLLLALFSCTPHEEETFKPTPYDLPSPLFFPSKNNIPADNPMTEEGVVLGKKLFFEDNSCSQCHREQFSFEGGPEATLEHLGTEHTMLPLINLVWNTTGLGWQGNVETLEDMVYAAFTDPNEIDADTAEVVKLLQQSDTYPELFKKAFGTDRITFVLVEKAIAQYVRSLVFADSKFDRYLHGEEQLTQDELNGYVLFTTEKAAPTLCLQQIYAITTASMPNTTATSKPLPFATSPLLRPICTTDVSAPSTRSSTFIPKESNTPNRSAH